MLTVGIKNDGTSHTHDLEIVLEIQGDIIGKQLQWYGEQPKGRDRQLASATPLALVTSLGCIWKHGVNSIAAGFSISFSVNWAFLKEEKEQQAN